MITYVNTVLVSNLTSNNIASALASGTKGQYVIVDADTNAVIDTTAKMTTGVKRIKVGMFTGETNKSVPVIRWSNIINRADIKKIATLTAPQTAVTEDSVEIDFTSASNAVTTEWAKGGKRIIVRLTFKDLPTRYRKWTESYEYVTVAGDTTATIASKIAALINGQVKRARVVADGTTTASKLVLTAMPYDDDNSVDTINRFQKGRFNVNIYWTDPAAEGWASLNKFFPQGVVVTKTPGFQYAASGKLVRDRENEAFGYLGIINRGSGTWPIVQPGMNADITKNYNAVTLEFENMYHTADDLMRKTKQTLEIYTQAGVSATDTIGSILSTFAGTSSAGEAYQVADTETEDFA